MNNSETGLPLLGEWGEGTSWAFPPRTREKEEGVGPAWEEEMQTVSVVRAVLGYWLILSEVGKGGWDAPSSRQSDGKVSNCRSAGTVIDR